MSLPSYNKDIYDYYFSFAFRSKFAVQNKVCYIEFSLFFTFCITFLDDISLALLIFSMLWFVLSCFSFTCIDSEKTMSTCIFQSINFGKRIPAGRDGYCSILNAKVDASS